MKNLFIIIFTIVTVSAFSTDKPAYKIFDKNGKEVSYSQMVETLQKNNIVFFGELHNNTIAHWLELQVTKSLFDTYKDKLVLGAEMFEADNQLLLTEYLTGLVKQKSFEDEMRLWPNYKTDYKPLVEFAKANKLPFIATNVPRRYAAVVSKHNLQGLDKLSDEAKRYIAPLPIAYDSTVGCYVQLKMMMAHMPGHRGGNNYMPQAQAVKDATMSHFILVNYKTGNLFLHFNGSYHSDNYEGIVWWIKKANPKLKVATISTVTQNDITALDKENQGVADFIIVVPEDMTTTY